MAFISIVKENLPIFGIAKQKTLSEFCTTEKDVSKGISRMPLILARCYEEDIKFEDGKSTQKFKISPKAVKNQRDDDEQFKHNMEIREAAKRESIKKIKANDLMKSSKIEQKTMDCDLDFDELMLAKSSGSSLLYRRDTLVTATFDDFEMIKCIGRGTFGKVYLVKCKRNGRLHAMKCIRKDIVIEHDSIDSLQVEKLILL
jgi:hypothetical protein